MPTTLLWSDIALRLALAFLAGLLLGFNRGERGKPAGLRTTLLVSLAAALAMILANALITTHGKTADSFVQLDMMRLPLGVLTGIGFIGAGTILKKGDLVIGVTTAATVWYATMLGFCFGAGKIGLGLAGLGLGVFILWGLEWLEAGLRQEHRGTLVVICRPADQAPLTEENIRTMVQQAGCEIVAGGVRLGPRGTAKMLRFELHWRARRHATRAPDFVSKLADHPGVQTVRWDA